MRLVLALIPALALTACGGDGGSNGSAPAASSAPVAAVAPPAGKQWVDVVEKTADGYRQGNPNAPIKLVEYGSRNCPACGQFGQFGAPKLREKYIATGKVSYEFRDFLIHGAPDFAAALLNQCVPTESFFGALDQFFAHQGEFLDRTEKLVKENQAFVQQVQSQAPQQQAVAFADALGYIPFMQQMGLPEAKARQCLTDQKAADAITKVNADAVNVHKVSGTPTFFINGEMVPNAAGWEALEPALQAAGAR